MVNTNLFCWDWSTLRLVVLRLRDIGHSALRWLYQNWSKPAVNVKWDFLWFILVGQSVQLRRSLRFDCRVAMSRQNLQKANETEADMHSSIHVWELFDFYLFNLFYFEFWTQAMCHLHIRLTRVYRLVHRQRRSDLEFVKLFTEARLSTF